MVASLKRIVTFALQSMWRNRWLAVATGTTVGLTVLSLSFLIAAHVGLQQVVGKAASRVDLQVFLYPAVTDGQANSVVVALHAVPGVSKISYQTKEQTLAAVRERAANDPEVLRSLETLGDNPFGGSLTIEADDAASYETVLQTLRQPQFTALIESQERHFAESEAFIVSFTAFANNVRLTMIVISAVFAAISGLMLFNAIRVGIYTHRQEIAIMRLVGASPSFIRGPFMVELVIHVVLAVLGAGGVFLAGLYFLQPQLSTYFGAGTIDLIGYFSRNWPVIFGAEFVLLLALGLLSTVLALRKAASE